MSCTVFFPLLGPNVLALGPIHLRARHVGSHDLFELQAHAPGKALPKYFVDAQQKFGVLVMAVTWRLTNSGL